MPLPVLTGEVRRRTVRRQAQVGRVFKQTLFPTLHREDELVDRSIRNGFERAANTTVDRVDSPVQDDMDLTIQVGNEIG
jgi:hypothetical protein